MTFDAPLFLLLLPLALLPLVAPRAERFAFPVPRGFLRRGRWGGRGLDRYLLAAAAAVGVVALAGPRRPSERTTVRRDAVDILLVLDTSASMTRADLEPDRTRLEVAVEEAARFVSGRPHDRIGLVTFARYPRLRCPLTLDHDALLEILADVRSVAGRSDERTTAIGVALASAVMALRKSPAETRLVVLVTDGQEEEHVIEPLEAARFAREEGVKVHTIAIARKQGRWTRELARIAQTTGGVGMAAGRAADLRRAWKRIDEEERTTIEVEEIVAGAPRTAEVLAAAFLLLVLAPLVRIAGFGRVP